VAEDISSKVEDAATNPAATTAMLNNIVAAVKADVTLLEKLVAAGGSIDTLDDLKLEVAVPTIKQETVLVDDPDYVPPVEEETTQQPKTPSPTPAEEEAAGGMGGGAIAGIIIGVLVVVGGAGGLGYKIQLDKQAANAQAGAAEAKAEEIQHV
jgi:hypothetical protein